MNRHVVGVVAVAAAVVGGGGCSGDDVDEDVLRGGFETVVAAADVRDVTGPNARQSKNVPFLTGSGFADGDADAAVGRAVAGLRGDGWEVGDPRPNQGGMLVAANDGTVAMQIGAYPKAGINEAPEGSSIIHISVAAVGAGFEWTG